MRLPPRSLPKLIYRQHYAHLLLLFGPGPARPRKHHQKAGRAGLLPWARWQKWRYTNLGPAETVREERVLQFIWSILCKKARKRKRKKRKIGSLWRQMDLFVNSIWGESTQFLFFFFASAFSCLGVCVWKQASLKCEVGSALGQRSLGAWQIMGMRLSDTSSNVVVTEIYRFFHTVFVARAPFFLQDSLFPRVTYEAFLTLSRA